MLDIMDGMDGLGDSFIPGSQPCVTQRRFGSWQMAASGPAFRERRTDDERSSDKEQQVNELVAPAADPLDACSPEQQLELGPIAGDAPVAAAFPPAESPQAPPAALACRTRGSWSFMCHACVCPSAEQLLLLLVAPLKRCEVAPVCS